MGSRGSQGAVQSDSTRKIERARVFEHARALLISPVEDMLPAQIGGNGIQLFDLAVAGPAERHEVAGRVVAADVPGDLVVCRQPLSCPAHQALTAVALDHPTARRANSGAYHGWRASCAPSASGMGGLC